MELCECVRGWAGKYVEITSQQSHGVTFKRICSGYCSHFMALSGLLELFSHTPGAGVCVCLVVQQALKGEKGFTPKSYNGTKILKRSYDGNDDNDESRSGLDHTQTTAPHSITCTILFSVFSPSESDSLQFIVSFILLLVWHTQTHADRFRCCAFMCVCVYACAVKKDTYEQAISISNEPIPFP